MNVWYTVKDFVYLACVACVTIGSLGYFVYGRIEGLIWIFVGALVALYTRILTGG